MMMVENQDSRFICKFCNKKYPCGKSLGGHIKSHVFANSVESEVTKTASDDPKLPELEKGQCQSGYGLRENPRKTRRIVDSELPSLPKRFCKQCGKGFTSLKALCGHMACHSEKEKGSKNDCLWTGENHHKVVYDSCSDTEEAEVLEIPKTISPKSANISGSSSAASEIDLLEQEDLALCLMMLSRDTMKGWMNSVVESSDNDSVAMEAKSSPIELRIAKKKNIVESCKPTKSPQIKRERDEEKLKGIAFNGEVMDSDSEYFLGLCTAKAESDVSFDGFRMNDTLSNFKKHFINTRKGIKSDKTKSSRKLMKEHEYDESRKRKYSLESLNKSRKMKKSTEDADVIDNSSKKSKYECFNCKKAFKSFQALGGHRPCHKRTNSYYESRYDSDENSLEDNNSSDGIAYNTENLASASSKKPKGSLSSQCEAKKKVKSKKNNKPHTCPYCNRVFKNGQAFGGHKRSHFLGGNNEEDNLNRTPEIKHEIPDLFDLNLPAPESYNEDGGNDGHFFLGSLKIK